MNNLATLKAQFSYNGNIGHVEIKRGTENLMTTALISIFYF